jgi:hypothetical protein
VFDSNESLLVYLAAKFLAMQLDLKEIIGRNGSFSVIDIIGSIPIGLRSKFGHIESEKASVTSGIIMIVFYCGRRTFTFDRHRRSFLLQ